jgi:hypothetical protein
MHIRGYHSSGGKITICGCDRLLHGHRTAGRDAAHRHAELDSDARAVPRPAQRDLAGRRQLPLPDRSTSLGEQGGDLCHAGGHCAETLAHFLAQAVYLLAQLAMSWRSSWIARPCSSSYLQRKSHRTGQPGRWTADGPSLPGVWATASIADLASMSPRCRLSVSRRRSVGHGVKRKVESAVQLRPSRGDDQSRGPVRARPSQAHHVRHGQRQLRSPLACI